VLKPDKNTERNVFDSLYFILFYFIFLKSVGGSEKLKEKCKRVICPEREAQKHTRLLLPMKKPCKQK